MTTIADHLDAKHGPQAQLLALADRCEREEPSRKLDVSISDALGYAHDGSLPFYTTSLDAAVTLVPEGFIWRVSGSSEGRFFASLHPAARDAVTGQAKTEPMARCAAALRARAAVLEQGDGK